jgi:proteic killer suppression protein
VIRSWRNAASRKVWEGGRPNQFRGLDLELATDLLLALNVAKSLQDLSPLKSVGLHKLKGDRKGQWAMTVNGPWRICFEFRRGDAYEVEIVDYHKGSPTCLPSPTPAAS